MLSYLKIANQVADVFIKGLSPSEFERNMRKLDMFDVYVQLD